MKLPSERRVQDMLKSMGPVYNQYEKDQLFELILQEHDKHMHEAAEELGLVWSGLYTARHLRILFMVHRTLDREMRHGISQPQVKSES
jgi:hypothetical protein